MQLGFTGRRWLGLMALMLAAALLLSGCSGLPAGTPQGGAGLTLTQETSPPAPTARPGDRDAVASYIGEHGKLPDYYITKSEARQLGWSGGSVEEYAPGKLIGGDPFGNYEGLLPAKAGRRYTECDINTFGKQSRGAERLVFSNDGLIYYTDDHYGSFTLLEGVE